jgi:alpha-glucosidase (family GH31 glycosyl hydrolase)
MYATPQDIMRGKNILFNMGDSIYMKNFFRAAHGGSEKIGVDFWWLDWQQNYLYNYVRGMHTKSLAWINKLYYDQSVRANRRGATYSRWAGFGSQRYPIQFSGDAVANWNVMAFEVKLTSTSGNAGCYYWAHDIGGFYGGKDPEMYARWTQFGSVSAALRVHSAKSSDIDRRPWLWGNAVLPSLQKSYRFRSQLMPYIYSSVWETHCTMVPLNRAMYIDYNGDQRAYNNPQEFMFGDLLLVAPITSPGKGERKIASQKVWFPGTETWYDYFDGKSYKGGTEFTIEKDINEFPLFVRGGYLLPLQPYTQRPASTPLKELILRCYPGQDGCNNTYTLYEDDGISRDYERGKYALTELCYQQFGKRVKIIISAAKGNYNGQVRQRSYLIELPVTKIQGKVMINTGKAIVITDKVNGMNRIFVGKKSIDKDVIIKFTMK